MTSKAPMPTDNPTHAELVGIRLLERSRFLREDGLNDDADLDLEAAFFIDSQASRIEELKAENKRLREIVSQCASEAGGFCSTDASLDFMAHVPSEVRARAALGGKP